MRATKATRGSSFADAARGAAESVPGVELAWVAGDLADVGQSAYLVVVGWVGLEEIDSLFDRVRLVIQAHYPDRGIELAYFPPDDWQKRLSADDRFTRELLELARIDLKSMDTSSAMDDVAGEQNASQEVMESVTNARRRRSGKGDG